MKKLVSLGIALLFLCSLAYADEVWHSSQYIRLNGDPSHNLSTWRDSGDYTKINAAYLWSLGNVPSGAGTLPAVNIPNLDADKITTGSIDNSVFSAYSDLTAEGYLDNDANGDLLTRTQSDSRFVNEGQADSITSGMVNFNYAASGSEGGAATGLACSGTCVSSGEVDFNYAAGATKGGAATSGDSATAFFSTGTLEDERIASTIARDSEVTAAIATKDECSEISGCVVGAITDDTSVPKNHMANSGTLGFDWADSEVVNDLTITSSGSVDAGAIKSGTVADARIASTIARDSEVTAAIATKDQCSEISGCVVGAITDDTSVPKNHMTNSGTLGFDWADSEVADALTITSSGSVDAGAIKSGTMADDRLSFTLQDAVNDGGCTNCITDGMVSNTLTASYATSAGSASNVVCSNCVTLGTETTGSYVASETDPQVASVTNGKWCRGTGSQVTCDQDAPSGGGCSHYSLDTGTLSISNTLCKSLYGCRVTVMYLEIGPSTQLYDVQSADVWYNGNNWQRGTYQDTFGTLKLGQKGVEGSGYHLLFSQTHEGMFGNVWNAEVLDDLIDTSTSTWVLRITESGTYDARIYLSICPN